MNNSDEESKRQAKLDRVKDAISGRGRKAISVAADNPAKKPTPPSAQPQHVFLDPITYNYKLVDEFINMVFHTPLTQDEHIPLYMDVRMQGLPIERKAFFEEISTTQRPARLYFGTATVNLDPIENAIRNRKALFTGYHVIVLDDIGTKIPLDRVPADFEPTYIIESSKGNFQYGYVLDEPIRDYEQARALVELVYSSGVTDEGGKIVVKKVRLPDGNNGKINGDPNFRVRLVHMDGPYYSPQAILNGAGVCAQWETIVADAAKSRLQNKVVGTSLFSPLNAQYASLDGVIDPITEWLVDNKAVRSFDGDWVCVECPWHGEHTKGDGTGDENAYYSPLGYGEGEYRAMRTFNCFHSHGDTYKTPQYLEEIVKQGGPHVAAFDPAGHLIAGHVFDSRNNLIYGIKDDFLRNYKNIDAFRLAYNKPVQVWSKDKHGKPELKVSSMGAQFLISESRVMVDGVTFDPRTTARIIRKKDIQQVNSFSPPPWGEGRYDMAIVQPFIDFIAYLIPNADECAVFTEWLACKAQNMGFRGWGMMMVAKNTGGTGRGTLANILTRLFDHRNCADVPFAKLINPTNDFNEWQSKLLIISNEASDLGDSKTFYKQYAQLKELIDTTAKHVTINNKYGNKEDRLLCTSHLIFTNEANGAAIDKEDRRMYVMSNTTTPESPQYFTALNAWMNETDNEDEYVFTKHVARWLKSLPTDFAKMQGQAPITRSKTEMIDASRSALDIFADSFFEALPSPYSTSAIFTEIMQKLGARLDFPSPNLIKSLYNGRANALDPSIYVSRNNKSARPRATLHHSFSEHVDDIGTLTHRPPKTLADKKALRRMKEALLKTDIIAVAKYIENELDLAGY